MNNIFQSYGNFVAYCPGIMRNKGIPIESKHHAALDDAQEFFDVLEYLQSNGIITCSGSTLETIVNLFKRGDIQIALNLLSYLQKKMSQFLNREENIYYLILAAQDTLGMEIVFSEHYLQSRDFDSPYYPEYVKCLVKFIGRDRIPVFEAIQIPDENVHGIYCIYDGEGKIGYIGKSDTCALRRSLVSVRQRHLLDFSRIEILQPKSISDIALYEAYLIGKLKPYENKDLMHHDAVTVELPQLPIARIIDRDPAKHFFEYDYTYYKILVRTVQEFLDCDDQTILLSTSANQQKLERQGIFDYSRAKNAEF